MLSEAATITHRRIRTIRTYGVVFTVRKQLWRLEDIAWERRRGIVTRTQVPLDELRLGGPNGAHAMHYETMRIGHMRDLLRSVPSHSPRHLVDYGAGLGRVLIAASLEGYESATGVELSTELCVGARQNVAEFRRRHPGDGRSIDVVEGDAVAYPIRPEQNVFFLYNPFGPAVLTPVLDAISSSVRDHPRQAWVIYANRVHFEVLLDRPDLELVRPIESQRYLSALFRVRRVVAP